MALTVRANGSATTNIIQAQWWNDYYNLLTGAMQDQLVTLQTNVLSKGLGSNPTAPSGVIATGTNLGIGNYTYFVTFTSAGPGESNPGNASATITTTTGNQAVNLSSIQTGPTGTTGRNIYRTKVGGTTYYFLASIADNTTTTYSDTIADASLTVLHQGYSTFGGTFMAEGASGTIRSQLSQDGVLNLSPTPTTINGSTTGSASLYQFQRGIYKQVVILFNNFRNGGGSAQNIAVPTPFTTGETWYNGGTTPIQFLLNGTAQTVGIVTTLASGGGTITLQTTINKYSFGDNYSGVDTISLLGSQPSSISGIFTMQGI